MRCPVCTTRDLEMKVLDRGLPAHLCESCGGHWISSTAYWYWLEQRGVNVAENEASAQIEVADNQQSKLCPECSRIMLMFRVGHQLNFALDQCASCNGVWFDKNEWESLKEKNLHDDIHLIFTASWQDEVRNEERRKAFEKIYISKFGEEDYIELIRVRAWLNAHSNQQEMIAFLMIDNPYGI
jgi:Zn-finger nucleic acid-binding protein